MEKSAFLLQLKQVQDLVQKTKDLWEDAAAEEYRTIMSECIREIEQIMEEQ